MLVRIGVFTNFNFTEKEIRKILDLKEFYENKIFYIWSNVKSINQNINKIDKFLLNKLLNHKQIKIGLTVTPKFSFIEPKIKPDNIIYKFVLNHVTENTNKKVLDYGKKQGIKILALPQRFGRKENFKKYISQNNLDKYKYKKNYYRLEQKYYLEFINNLKKEYTHIYPCDLLEKGCETCNNCYRINDLKPSGVIAGIDLKVSGLCKHNCVDCYAKYVLYRTKNRLTYDTIKINSKQKKKVG